MSALPGLDLIAYRTIAVTAVSQRVGWSMKVDRGLLQKCSLDQPMSRRTFSRMLGVFLLAAPRMAMAQGSTVVRRIGVLEEGEPDSPEFIWKQAEPLRELGWVEGQNLHVERRYAKNPEALQPLGRPSTPRAC